MSGANTRRFAIAVALLVLAAAVYLLGSGGPRRVPMVKIPTHSVILLTACGLAWGGSLRLRQRLVGLLLLVTVGTVVAVYLDSLVIMALRPLHPLYFVIGLPATAVEVAVFLSVVWGLDWVWTTAGKLLGRVVNRT